MERQCGSLLVLGYLRDQTLVVAAWALAVCVFLFRSERPLPVRFGAVAFAIVVPAFCGAGLAGYSPAEQAVPQLATIRSTMSIGAESAFVEPPAEPPVAAPSQPGGADPGDGSSQLDSGFSALPRGLVAVTLRPFPWEPARTPGILLAQLENLVWAILYVLAAVGAWLGRRKRHVLAFPIIATVMILVVVAVTQGNLGTAFRHRGQVLWALVTLAVVALHHLRQARSSVIETSRDGMAR